MVKKSASGSSGGNKKASSVLSTIAKKFNDTVRVGAFTTGPIDVLSTGSLTMDIATGLGGIPRGAITELSGIEASAKTTTCLRIVADAQRRGYTAAFIDTEHILDVQWAAKQGVKISKDNPKEGMIVINADTLESAAEVAVLLASSGEFDVIIFDSIAGAPIAAQVDGDVGDSNMGRRAKILSNFAPKLNSPVRKNNVWFVFTNQLRFSMEMYGDKYVTPGGKAIPHHSALRAQMQGKKEKTEPGKEPTYTTVTGKFNKNKLAPPFRTFEYELYFDTGTVNHSKEVASILTDAKNLDLLGITRSGSFYTLPREMVPSEYGDDELRFQGAAKVEAMLLSDVDHLYNNVIPYIRRKLIPNEDMGYREHQGRGAEYEDSDDFLEDEDDEE